MSCQQGVITASVVNPLPDEAFESRGHQLAMDNIRQRLDALYGASGRLEVFPQAQQFEVRLSYPLERPN